jgi:Fe-S-cluster containining protein
MTEEQIGLLTSAKSRKKEIKKIIHKACLSKEADSLFHSAHEDVFQRTDCLTCANCCKTTSPIFRDKDIDRIAWHLGLRPSAFVNQYLYMDDEGDWVLHKSPCAFLQEDNACSIYQVRPKACRDYPHTDRKNIRQVESITQKNALICPAVAEMVQIIEKAIS